MSEESKEKQERAPSARTPEERLASFLMCNILAKQADPDWIPEQVTWGFTVIALRQFAADAEQRGRERGIEEAARRAGDPDADPWVHLRDKAKAILMSVAEARWADLDLQTREWLVLLTSAPALLRALLAGNADPKGTPPSPSREDLLWALRAAREAVESYRIVCKNNGIPSSEAYAADLVRRIDTALASAASVAERRGATP